MRVLHLSNSDSRGGAAIAAYRLHTGLKELGSVDSLFYCQRKYKKELDSRLIPGSNLFRAKVKNKVVGGFCSAIDREYSRWPSSLCGLNSDIPDLVASLKPDLVHLHWVQGEMLSVKDIGLIRTPIAWTFHDSWPFCGVEHHPKIAGAYEDGYSDRPYFSLKEGINLNRINWEKKKLLYPRYGIGISPSTWMYKHALKSPLMEGWDHYVAPHFVETLREETKKESREILGLPTNALVLYTPAGSNRNNDPFKGYQFLKEIMVKLKERNLSVLVVGIGAELPSVGLETRVFQKSFATSYVSRILNASDVCLIPSLFESFSLTALEAHSQGVPVVCFDSGGINDVVADHQTGLVCEVGKCGDIAIACDKLLRDHQKRKQFSFDARTRAETLFSEQNSINRHLDIYKKLLEKSQ